MEGPNSSPFLAVSLIFEPVFGYLASQPQPFHTVIWAILHGEMAEIAVRPYIFIAVMLCGNMREIRQQTDIQCVTIPA